MSAPTVKPIAPDTPSQTQSNEKVWVVVRSGGDRHYIDREPDEGIEAWAKGQDILVLEYTLTRIIRQRPAKAKP